MEPRSEHKKRQCQRGGQKQESRSKKYIEIRRKQVKEAEEQTRLQHQGKVWNAYTAFTWLGCWDLH